MRRIPAPRASGRSDRVSARRSDSTGRHHRLPLDPPVCALRVGDARGVRAASRLAAGALQSGRARPHSRPARGGAPARCLDLRRWFRRQFESAFPSLHARGLTATFFLTIGFVERTPDVLARMARALADNPGDEITPLDWGEVDAMHRSGMAFGSHTMSHPNLAAIDGATARREMRDSKQRLEDRLQVPITSLAYPFGKLRHHVTPVTVDLAHESGYEQAVSTHAVARSRTRTTTCACHGSSSGTTRSRSWPRRWSAPSIGMPTCASDCHGRCRERSFSGRR